MTSSTLREMTRLHLSRPAADAPVAVVAAWYVRKAVLMQHLAAEHTHGADDAARLAVQAQEHATRLMTRNPTSTGPGSAVRSAKTESAEPGLPGYESTRREGTR